MAAITNKVLFGDFENSTMYPNEDKMMEAVMIEFGIDDDLEARSQFMTKWKLAKQGPKGIRSIVQSAFIKKRSAMGSDARTELF